ncbi:MAG: HEAT repeat domain-containing protein, partial [Blastocatellia bacterium]
VYGRDSTLEWMDDLIDRKLLATTHGSYPVVYLTPRGRKALDGSALIGLRGLKAPPPTPASRPPASAPRTGRPATDSKPLERSVKPTTSDENALRIEVEMWRQGGPCPDPEALVQALHSERISQGDLVVFINALGELDCKDAAPILRDKLADIMSHVADATVAAALCNSLGRLGVFESAPELILLLDDQRALIRAAAVRSVSRLRVRDALDKLVELAENDSAASVRLAARAAVLLITDAVRLQTG